MYQSLKLAFTREGPHKTPTTKHQTFFSGLQSWPSIKFKEYFFQNFSTEYQYKSLKLAIRGAYKLFKQVHNTMKCTVCGLYHELWKIGSPAPVSNTTLCPETNDAEPKGLTNFTDSREDLSVNLFTTDSRYTGPPGSPPIPGRPGWRSFEILTSLECAEVTKSGQCAPRILFRILPVWITLLSEFSCFAVFERII
jgi:hypothetical protein